MEHIFHYIVLEEIEVYLLFMFKFWNIIWFQTLINLFVMKNYLSITGMEHNFHIETEVLSLR